MSHWTDTHPDRKMWSPGRLAVARTQTQEEYEALYGRGVPLEVSPGTSWSLAASGSTEFLLEYQKNLLENITADAVRRDPLFRAFLRACSSPNDYGWQRHFEKASVEGVFGVPRGREELLWEWNPAVATGEFFKEAEQRQAEILNSCQGEPRVQKCLESWQWVNACRDAAREDRLCLESEELLENGGKSNPLIALDITVHNFWRSEGYDPVSQKERTNFILQGSSFSQDGGSLYIASRVGGIAGREAELSGAAFCALLLQDNNLPPLLDLQKAIGQSLADKIKEADDLLSLLGNWEAMFARDEEDLQKLRVLVADKKYLAERVGEGLYSAGWLWNKAWARADQGPSASPSACILEGFQKAFNKF